LTSDSKANANRANGRASTGPRTLRGRARAGRNARRHGLNVPIGSDPALCDQVKELTRAIAGADASGQIKELARRVAEAQIDLQRVRNARHQFLCRALTDPGRYLLPDLRRGLSIARRLLRNQAVSREDLAELKRDKMEEAQKFAMIVSQELNRLLAMDRYERQARFRRNKAIQALEEARRFPLL
jgi:hypothetical protein